LKAGHLEGLWFKGGPLEGLGLKAGLLEGLGLKAGLLEMLMCGARTWEAGDCRPEAGGGKEAQTGRRAGGHTSSAGHRPDRDTRYPARLQNFLGEVRAFRLPHSFPVFVLRGLYFASFVDIFFNSHVFVKPGLLVFSIFGK
jgi:hypothetical protein